MLLIKLLLAPVIVVAVTLIGRRWGPRVAGLAVGLPVTTGPVSVFLAMERGPAFAARAAVGALAGLVGTAAFCAAYALAARRREWPGALAAALATLAAVTLALHEAPLTLAEAIVLALVALPVLWLAVTRAAVEEEAAALTSARTVPTWDLPARIVATTTIIAAVTAAAGVLGSELSGVFSALPVMGGVLGIFAHHGDGRAAAISLMRGLIIGCVSGVAFFGIVGGALAAGHVGATYLLATLAALGTGAAVSLLNRAPAPADVVVEADAEPFALRRAA